VTEIELAERLNYVATILEANADKFAVPDHIPAKVRHVREAADKLEALSGRMSTLVDAAWPFVEDWADIPEVTPCSSTGKLLPAIADARHNGANTPSATAR
jgi:hypothetical protein